MKIGMLWFDNDPKATLEEKVRRAAEYYLRKYGKTANLCYVHPGAITGNAQPGTLSEEKPAVEIRISRTVRPNHLWLGVNSAVEGCDV